MSLWTLQDSFITILKGINTGEGLVITPEIEIKSDGTQELKFSIPMYHRDESGELVENPIWYNTKNGNLMANLRKIKVIFNKGEKGVEGVYEFVINKIKETHSKGQLTCEVEAEGLAFQELGKTGYKLVLNYDEFAIDAEEDLTLIPTLQYWADKVFKDSHWTYSIQMDWSAYDGIIDDVDYENLPQTEKDALNDAREAQGRRRRDRMYEEGYVVSWKYDALSNLLVPYEIENFQEKARTPDIEKSNRYNITQSLAELFGIFCKYKYSYDENYHIIGRECIFYNNFFGEDLGHIDINYPYNTNEITREGESSDTVTKLYVVPVDDVSIQDVKANKSGEDYILNFDYLYSIGTISDEQYAEIEEYEKQMFIYNSSAKEKSEELIKKEDEITDKEASLSVANNSLIYANEQVEKAKQSRDALIEGRDGESLKKTKLNPQQIYLYDEGGSYAVRSLGLEGIDPNTIIIYTKYTRADGVADDSPIIYFSEEENAVYDKTTLKNLESISGLRYYADENGEKDATNLITKAMKAYMVCEYSPSQKYNNLIELYTARATQDSEKIATLKAEIAELENDIEDLNKELEQIYEAQAKKRTSFENLMGPALREGSWQAEEYSDSGDKYYAEIAIGESDEDKLIRGFWDSELFDDEEMNYDEVSILETKEYYPTIDLTGLISTLKPYIKQDYLCLRYSMEVGGKTENYNLSISSQVKYGIIALNNYFIKPILYITKDITNVELEALKTNGRIGYLSYSKDSNNIVQENFTQIATLSSNLFLDENTLESYKTVYPRFEIQSEYLRTEDETELNVKIFEDSYSYPLTKYEDYYILYRSPYYYITIKPEVYLEHWGMDKFILNYIISNANLRLYLDALEVSKTNAYPQVSYEVKVSALNTDLVKTIYSSLNRIVNINDSELKFKNVQGYISELKLKLDTPWEDEITVKNYKTKFEDLFSRIVASTELMKTNTVIYNRAANAFTSSGLLTSDVIQSTLSRVDLNYAFNNGKLTINEKEGIWGISDSGVVAIRGGGIFCATEQDFSGNWIWHTGIVPEGINASLLTAGVIDTNVIRIFAGDNIRFQMNASGLYSFGENEETGETDFNNYVVSNSEGLFLIKKSYDVEDGETVANILRRVEISWDGFILRDDNNEMVFYADPATGSLVLKGTIYADEGIIGGWILGENYLMSQEKVYLVQKDEEGNTLVDEEGNPILDEDNLLKYRQIALASNPDKDETNLEKFENAVYDAVVVGRIINAETQTVEKEGLVITSDGTLTTNFAKVTHLTANSAAIGGFYISDVISQINQIKIQPLTGDIFKWKLGEDSSYSGRLKFTILTGLYDDIDFSTWTLYRSTSIEEGATWEKINDFSVDANDLTFYLNDGIMKIEEEVKDIVYIKVTVQRESGEILESEITTLYNVYDGMDGVVDFFLLHATDFIFILQNDNIYTPTSSTISVELHGNLKAENGYWTIGNEEGAERWYVGETSFEVSPEDFSTTSITYYYHNEGVVPSSISLCKVRDGKDAGDSLIVSITSSAGNIFRSGELETTLSAHIYLNGEEIEGEDLNSYYFRWWEGVFTEEIGYIDEGIGKNVLEVKAADINKKAVYNCEVYPSVD